MGLLTNKIVKDPVKRFWIGVILNIILILVFLYFALNTAGEFMVGYELGRSSCLNLTLNCTIIL